MELPNITTNRRLLRAVGHVTNYWFPVNPILYNRIRNGLQDGTYDLGAQFIFEDLKKDFALFMYCLHGLVDMLREEGVTLRLEDPVSYLEVAGTARIRRLFEREVGEVFHHNILNLEPMQAMQLQIAFTSAATTEVLAENRGLPSQPAFLAALLRQLGRTLICFNYPTVFRRAIQTQSADRPLDMILSDLLGFSPLMLAIALLPKWNLGAELSRSLQQAEHVDTPEASDKSDYIAQLCRVGEALAQANYPEMHATAPEDWKFAKEKIEAALGREGLSAISQRAREYCSAYEKINPKMFAGTAAIDPERKIFTYLEKNLLSTNQYAQECPSQLRKRFKEFYTLVMNKIGVKEAVNFLVQNVFPLSGFSTAVVYTLDTDQDCLVPRLRIAWPRLRSLGPIPHQISQNPNDVVTAAFNCSTPLHGHDATQGCSYAAARLGRARSMGVFYVEIANNKSHSSESHLNYFKACRQALHDALRI